MARGVKGGTTRNVGWNKVHLDVANRALLGWTNEQIMLDLGISEAALMKRVARIRKKVLEDMNKPPMIVERKNTNSHRIVSLLDRALRLAKEDAERDRAVSRSAFTPREDRAK